MPEPRLAEAIARADAVVVGAGAGLSAAAGLTYDGERFHRLFGDFIAAYQLTDMYSSAFFQFPSPEVRWAYWSRHIMANRYDPLPTDLYGRLRGLLDGREYTVITTNVDHAFIRAGFDPERVFAVQGNYGRWQCSVPCRQETWGNESAVRRMVAEQRDQRIPTALVPSCPWCGAPATMNLRVDHTFVQDPAWYASAERYQRFLDDHTEGVTLYLELGVGWNTPGIIKYAFWRRVAQNPAAAYAVVNRDIAVPRELVAQTLTFPGDLSEVLGRHG